MAGFRKAKGEQAALKIGMYGPPGSGKTFTALLLAERLGELSGKRVAFVDTERGTDFYCQAVPSRGVHPAAFDFDCLYTKSMTEILAACKGIKPTEYGVVVIDSITHVWEAARLAYEGKQTRAGTIPMHAWGTIKKPYKELMNLLLSSPMHVILCGRQGTEYATDEETDEIKAVGVKMKAEGETPYEPHVLIRMEGVRGKKGQATITAYVEKDRTGVLAGKTIQWPTFDNLCAPMMPLLGGTQAKIQTDDEVSQKDAEALGDQERDKRDASDAALSEWSAKIALCRDQGELAAIGKQLTPDVKAAMLAAHVTELREKYKERERALSGQRSMEAIEH